MAGIQRIQQIRDYFTAINVWAPQHMPDFLLVDYNTIGLEEAQWLPAVRLGCFEINLDLTAGCAIRVDKFTISSEANRLTLISPYRLQSTIPGPGIKVKSHKGYGIFFTPEFMFSNFLNESLSKDFPFFSPFNPPSIYLNDETAAIFVDIICKIAYEQKNYGAISRDIIKSYLNILFFKAKQHYYFSEPSTIDRESQIFHAFQALVQKHYNQITSVKQYAELMHLSSKHLSQTVKKVSGSSALQIIHKAQINYAATQLLHSSKSVSEIAYELNFEDPNYFSVFFKRLTGKAPLQFRNN